MQIDERTQIAPNGQRMRAKALAREQKRDVATADESSRHELFAEMISELDKRSQYYDDFTSVKTLVEVLDFIKVMKKDMLMLIRYVGDLATFEHESG